LFQINGLKTGTEIAIRSFGKHKYSPEEWGFDPAQLREKMRPYTDHYDVVLEG
jgi:hypothetical protein